MAYRSPPMKEIFEIMKDLSPGEVEDKIWIHLENFLDYSSYEGRIVEERFKLTKDEPIQYDNIDFYYYSFMSGVVHKSCNDYEIPMKKWVNNTKWVLKEPRFDINAKRNLRLVLLYRSPVEFKARNIFVSANCLTRV